MKRFIDLSPEDSMDVIYKNKYPLKNDARTTYHKLLQELTKWGHLQYRPSNSS